MSVKATRIPIPYDLKFEVELMYHYILKRGGRIVDTAKIGPHRYNVEIVNRSGEHMLVGLYA